ncbi:MAG: VIT1/CCC1 transporter family protein [Proteobacteria bacterium]|nr:VIT1/CCC1 transporter family protein [Pseudomonadota bacterium]
MPATPHIERHFSASETVRDVVIGMADGLTVPFALAAGLSGAVASTDIVVVAGLAEVAAGAIAMGLGGYLAARTDAQHYESERRREVHEVQHLAERERREVADIFTGYGLSGPQLDSVVDAIAADPDRWVDFMMRHELGLEAPDPRRAPLSALTIGGSYLVGGLVPLAAYFFTPDAHRALMASIAVTGVALLAFGAVKAKLTAVPVMRGALETLLVGGLAAAVAFAVAKFIG